MKFLMIEDDFLTLQTHSTKRAFSLEFNPNHWISSGALRGLRAMLKHKGGLQAEHAEKDNILTTGTPPQKL